jgi:hypothetical protein
VVSVDSHSNKIIAPGSSNLPDSGETLPCSIHFQGMYCPIAKNEIRGGSTYVH